ncbi:MAG TPA: hypothetical protein VND97_03930 [Beijerinckiaceae bacterium]|nr:hypothetical protein [Beijerinckiaceae bacterium]
MIAHPLANLIGVRPSGWSPFAAALAVLAAWYGAECVLARSAGWHLGWRSPLAFLARDLAMPAIWTAAWLGDEFEWRGTSMSVSTPNPRIEALKDPAPEEVGGAT